MNESELIEQLLPILSKLDDEKLPEEVTPFLEYIEMEVPGDFGFPQDMILNLDDFASDYFDDQEMADYLGLEDDIELNDEARVENAFTALKREFDNHVLICTLN